MEIRPSSAAEQVHTKVLPTGTTPVAIGQVPLRKSAQRFAMSCHHSAAGTYTCKLQGSLDGTLWTDIVSRDNTNDGLIVWAVDKSVMYLQVLLSADALAGGETVTAKILVMG